MISTGPAVAAHPGYHSWYSSGRGPVPDLAAIRASRNAIAGYASLFNRVTTNGNTYVPGAFRAADVRYLLREHAGFPTGAALPSLASVGRGTLHVETDRLGLWFEAALDAGDAAEWLPAIGSRRIGVSIGWTGSVEERTLVNGVNVYRAISLFEISLVKGHGACPGVWVDAIGDALRRRRFQG